jgi:hypothetical protein
MKNILLDVESILKKYHNIGVMVSGGLDSTLLAYLLYDIRNKNELTNQIQLFVVPRPDDSYLHVQRVVRYLDKHFNMKSDIIIAGTGDVHHSKQLASGLKEVIQKYDCDVFLTAITTNPPEKLPNYQYGTFKDENGVAYDGPNRIKSNHPRIVDAFWDYTKKDTVKLIKDLNLTEIMNLSHTCTGSKLIRCGKCWQCCERAWGFSQNNFKDTGKM